MFASPPIFFPQTSARPLARRDRQPITRQRSVRPRANLEEFIAAFPQDALTHLQSAFEHAAAHNLSAEQILVVIESQISTNEQDHKEEEPSPKDNTEKDDDTYQPEDDLLAELSQVRDQNNATIPQQQQPQPVASPPQLDWAGLNQKVQNLRNWIIQMPLPASFNVQIANSGAASVRSQSPEVAATASREQSPVGQSPTASSSASVVSTEPFVPRFPGNLAKGNFFLTPEMGDNIMSVCSRSFDSEEREKEFRSYFHHRTAIQIIHEQVFVSLDRFGKSVIFIDIDLKHRITNNTLYLEARENDAGFVEKTKWKIVGYKTASQIEQEYGITSLPQATDMTTSLEQCLFHSPNNLRFREFRELVNHTSFTKMKSLGGNKKNRMSVAECHFRRCVLNAFEDNNRVFIPTVVVVKDEFWVEWKMPVQIEGKCVMISMRFNRNREYSYPWTITCLDYDGGCVYFKHQLLNLKRNDRRKVDWQTLLGFATTSLKIIQ